MTDYTLAMKAVAVRPNARQLRIQDIPALERLESRQWSSEQRAGAAAMASRIERWPELSLGSFDPTTGQATASLFMRPIDAQACNRVVSWIDAVEAPAAPRSTRSLFGISFTSVDPEGANALFRYFWPVALRAGWRDIFLGSPIPGFAEAVCAEPNLDVNTYVQKRRGGLPRDPQLRYYHRRGFTEIIAAKPGYFPHEASLNHGVLLRGRIPLSAINPVWQLLPGRLVGAMTGALASLVAA